MNPRRPPQLAGSAFRQTARFLKDPFALIDDGVGQHGDIFSVRLMGFGQWTFLCSPELVRAMFKAPGDVLVAGEANRAQLGFMLGTNASFSLDGEAHRQRQKMVHPFLNRPGKTHGLVPIMHRLTRRMVDGWTEGQALPFLHAAHRLSLDVMVHCLLSDSDPQELDALCGLFDRFAGKGLRSPLVAMPYLQWDLGRWSPWGRILHMRRQVMQRFRHQVQQRCLPGNPGQDPLSQLAQVPQSSGEPLTETALLEELINLLFAGHETTGTILTWTLECLLAHPEVLEALQAELHTELGDRAITPAHLDSLPYLHAVIQESIRFRPIAPMAGVRLVKKPFEVGGFEVPPGQLIVQCFPAMARRPELFERPDVFDPAHFFQRKMTPFTWNPFGGGTRMCIGRGLAELELKVVLATLLQEVDFRLVQPQVKPVRNGFFFAPNDGLRVSWSRRR